MWNMEPNILNNEGERILKHIMGESVFSPMNIMK
jgi:hypothetical protein